MLLYCNDVMVNGPIAFDLYIKMYLNVTLMYASLHYYYY